MDIYINGELKQQESMDSINDSFAVLLMSAIIFYRDFGKIGEEMLITFSDEEEAAICNSARELLSNRCSQPNDPEEVHEKTLFAKALQAMISTIPTSSLETLRLCTYIRSVTGKTQDRRVGILYHSFSTFHRNEKGTSFTISPIEFTMKV